MRLYLEGGRVTGLPPMFPYFDPTRETAASAQNRLRLHTMIERECRSALGMDRDMQGIAETLPIETSRRSLGHDERW